MRSRSTLLAFGLTVLLAGPGTAVHGQQNRIDVLRIAATGTLTGDPHSAREKAGLEMLRRFLKDETGLENDIVGEQDWRELADSMAEGKFQLALFQGYEFAWAQEKHPDLKPLALAVNLDRYPVACLMVARSSPAGDFAALRGQSLSVPVTCHGYLRLFVERRCEAGGGNMGGFFSKITCPDNVEDALDDVVDGKVDAAVADRAALEAYKRRKPGRFNQLKEVAQSQRFPPVVIAYYDKVLDDETLNRFQMGLLNAQNKEKGQTMLTLFRLTGFQKPPKDFDQVIAETLKNYPPPDKLK
jgi:ABC-type phosphate/phosphonate transport system substrate-binding protein